MPGRPDALAHFTDIPDEFRTDAATMTNAELEKRYNRSGPTIVHWRKLVKVPSPPHHPTQKVERYRFPDPEAKSYAEAGQVLITGDCMVTSDWHVPYHNLALAERMLRIAHRDHIKQLAIVGDLFDAATLSSFDAQDIEFGVRDELAATLLALQHLLKHFTHIYWSLGNHEIRLLKTLKFQVDLPDVAKWLIDDPRLTTTALPWMYLDSGGERFRLTHPASYSRVATRVAVQLADRFGCHVMAGHDHLFGFAMSLSGHWRAIEIGGLFDPDKLSYKHARGDTTHPASTPGFWTVRHGVTTPYCDRMVDWEAMFPEKSA